MPLSIGAVASHFTVDSFDTYDYPANLLTYTSVAPTWGATSGEYDSALNIREKCRFDIEKGYWYTLTFSVTAIQDVPNMNWYLGSYIGRYEAIGGSSKVGNNTCDFGACPSPGPASPFTIGDKGTFYFFAPYSTADCSFRVGAPYGSGSARGLWNLKLSKSSTQWTELTSISGIAVDSTPTQLIEFQTTDTMNPFLVCNRTTPFGVSTVNGLTVSAVLDAEIPITLPRLPAVFQYSEQLRSGTWKLSGSATSARTLDVFVFTETPTVTPTVESSSGIPAIWSDDTIYNIGDYVWHDSNIWVCNHYAPAGAGPFGGYLDGTAPGHAGIIYWVDPAPPLTPTPDTYISFDSQSYSRFAYEGRNVVFLIPEDFTGDNSSLVKMKDMIEVFDRAWSFYYSITSRIPPDTTNTVRNGKETIAVVDSTCGYGCGYLGAKGIELSPTAWSNLRDNVFVSNLYDSILFYELGRSFWFYGNKVAYDSPDDVGTVETGFAVFMRFMSMEQVNVSPWTFNGTNFTVFKNEVKGLLTTYINNPSYNWHNTLKIGSGVPNILGLGSTDLFASFLFDLTSRYGNGFVANIWKNVNNQPDAMSTQDAVDNFIIASSITANANLVSLFTTYYRWPITPAAENQINLLFP